MIHIASGCIVAACSACYDLIWEDEFDFAGDIMLHSRCKKSYIKCVYHMTEEQFEKLVGVNQLKQEIEQMKELERERHNINLVAIKALENKLDKILSRQK